MAIAYHSLPLSWQLPHPNGSGLLPSGEANFVDVRQYYRTDTSWFPINAYYPVGNDSLGDNREYPPQAWWAIANPTTDLQVGFFLSGLYVTYPTRTSGHLIGIDPEWDYTGKGNPTTSGIVYSVLAPDRLSFREANLSNAADSQASVISQGLYDFDIFNPYIHYYGKTSTAGTAPMPKWEDIADYEPETLISFSDAVYLNYKNLYPRASLWKQYEDHDQYEASSEEADCAAGGGTWVDGECIKDD